MKFCLAGNRRYFAFSTEAVPMQIRGCTDDIHLSLGQAKGGLSHQSIKIYVATVRNLHVTAGQYVEIILCSFFDPF